MIGCWEKGCQWLVVENSDVFLFFLQPASFPLQCIGFSAKWILFVFECCFISCISNGSKITTWGLNLFTGCWLHCRHFSNHSQFVGVCTKYWTDFEQHFLTCMFNYRVFFFLHSASFDNKHHLVYFFPDRSTCLMTDIWNVVCVTRLNSPLLAGLSCIMFIMYKVYHVQCLSCIMQGKF